MLLDCAACRGSENKKIKETEYLEELLKIKSADVSETKKSRGVHGFYSFASISNLKDEYNCHLKDQEDSWQSIR